MRRRTIFLTATVVILAATAGCGLFGGDSDTDGRMVELDKPRTSPSGDFTASVIAGPDQNGVATRVVVISDKTGKEVFTTVRPTAPGTASA